MSRKDLLYLLLLISIGAGIFFGTMSCRDLWEPEELRYAEVTREMVQDHEWFVLHLNGVKYPDKPPLFFWAIALCARCVGVLSEFAVRLPSVLSGLGVLVFTFLLGRQLFGAGTGFLAGVFLLTMPFFAQMAIEARMDLMLTMFITASLFCFYTAHARGHGTWLYLIGYLLMGLGILTKGPVGALLPLIAFAVFVLLKESLRGTASLRKKCGVLVGRLGGRMRLRVSPFPLRLGWGLLVMLLVVGPWLIPACIIGGGSHTLDLLFHQNVDRYFRSWTHQNEPWFLYFLYVPLQVIPWLLFLPCMIVYGISGEPAESRWQRRFPLVWLLAVVLFFTLCSSKRWIYTLPVLPAAALLMAGVAKDCLLPEGNWQGALRTLFRATYVVTLAVMGLCAVGAPIGALIGFREWTLVVLPGSIVAAVGAAAGLYLFFKERPRFSLAVTFVALLAAWAVTCWTFFPHQNHAASAKIMLKKVSPFVPEGEPLYTYGSQRNGYAYYWQRPPGLVNISTEGPPEEGTRRLRMLLQGPKPIFCLVSQRTYEYLRRDPALKSYVVLSNLMGSRNLVLVSNHPVR